MDTLTHLPAAEDIAAEWDRRAARPGLTRVMRASQPTELAEETTARTRGLVADYLRAVAPATALEIGCGMGRLTPTIAAHARDVLAVDMTARMVELARAACADLPHVRFLHAKVQDLPRHAPRFDVAVCVWVLMHVLDDAELATACQAIAAASRHLVLVEYEHAEIPVGKYSRLRQLDDYLAVLPGARLLERRDLHYGGDRSFAALIALEDAR
ncbi:class I SAM-dependent methyltransferase [Saccharothrix variisporea]|uniref:Methyltransferase family protein n=1 Tax=Saccharothrix variisporea TaxID=543527 RepID=A0A495X7K8_9PSEU|nr:class I SAM-dependent methyltransferase [Saccharothrix variisporea]RKT67498.1 methyltransferase family protein [Saccharothrix variisporea]